MLLINYVDISFLIEQSLHDFNQDLRIHCWLLNCFNFSYQRDSKIFLFAHLVFFKILNLFT